jgi:hypothetical protein
MRRDWWDIPMLEKALPGDQHQLYERNTVHYKENLLYTESSTGNRG